MVSTGRAGRPMQRHANLFKWMGAKRGRRRYTVWISDRVARNNRTQGHARHTSKRTSTKRVATVVGGQFEFKQHLVTASQGRRLGMAQTACAVTQAAAAHPLARLRGPGRQRRPLGLSRRPHGLGRRPHAVGLLRQPRLLIRR